MSLAEVVSPSFSCNLVSTVFLRYYDSSFIPRTFALTFCKASRVRTWTLPWDPISRLQTCRDPNAFTYKPAKFFHTSVMRVLPTSATHDFGVLSRNLIHFWKARVCRFWPLSSGAGKWRANYQPLMRLPLPDKRSLKVSSLRWLSSSTLWVISLKSLSTATSMALPCLKAACSGSKVQALQVGLQSSARHLTACFNIFCESLCSSCPPTCTTSSSEDDCIGLKDIYKINGAVCFDKKTTVKIRFKK